MLSAWAPKTISQYNTPINRWVAYCEERGISPLDASVQEGAEFLADLFSSSSLGYSAMGSARSALSAILKPTEGVPFGKHPLICRLLKGMCRQRPYIPKYSVTYDVNIVLNFMDSITISGDKSLEMVTKKFATIMCLLSGHRSQSIGVLKLEYMYLDKSKAIFYLPELLKNSSPKFHPLPLEFLAYPQNPRICVVTLFYEYLVLTGRCSKDNCKGNLFLSYAKPFKPVQSVTIAKYVLSFLSMAGVDITTFSSHSTRGASTSSAKARGRSLSEICKAAGWKGSRSFAAHYQKPIRKVFSQELQNQHSDQTSSLNIFSEHSYAKHR